MLTTDEDFFFGVLLGMKEMPTATHTSRPAPMKIAVLCFLKKEGFSALSSSQFMPGYFGAWVARPIFVMPMRPTTSRTLMTIWYCVVPSPRTTTGKSGT